MDFFAPIYDEYGSSECILSNWLFDFSQTAYKIEPCIKSETCQRVVEIKSSSPPSQFANIVQIIAIFTIALPFTIIAFVEKYLYRWHFRFQVCNVGSQIKFEQLFSYKPTNEETKPLINQVTTINKHFNLFNQNIKNIIYSNCSHSDRFSLLQTEHSMYEDPTLQKEQQRYLLLKRIFRLVHSIKIEDSDHVLTVLKNDCLEKIGEIFTSFNVERAISIVSSIQKTKDDKIHRKIQALKKILASVAKSDPYKALALSELLTPNVSYLKKLELELDTNQYIKVNHNTRFLSAIALTIAESDLLRAYRIANMIESYQLKRFVLIDIELIHKTITSAMDAFKEIKKFNVTNSPTMHSSIKKRVSALLNLAESLYPSNKIEVEKLLDQIFIWADTESSYGFFVKIARILMPSDEKKALHLVNQAVLRLHSEQNESRYYQSALEMVKELSKFNLEKAFDIANSIKGDAYKDVALQSLIIPMTSSDPKRAFELFKTINYSPVDLLHVPNLNFSLRHKDLCAILTAVVALPKNVETKNLIIQIWNSIKPRPHFSEDNSTWAEMLEIIATSDQTKALDLGKTIKLSENWFLTNHNFPYASMVTALALKKINPKKSLEMIEAAEDYLLDLRPLGMTLENYQLNDIVRIALIDLTKAYASLDPNKALTWCKSLDIEKNQLLEICKIILDGVREAMETTIDKKGNQDEFEFGEF